MRPRSRFALVAAAALLVSGAFGVAGQSGELPVVVPSLPPRDGSIRNPITFDQLHNFTGPSADGQCLHLDLGGAAFQGAVYAGPYPFCEGASDYDHAAFLLSGTLTNGATDVPAAAFLQDAYNANAWPQGTGSEPPTMTVAYRIDLRSVSGDTVTSYGLYDSLVSFRQEGPSVAKNLTLVEGPYLALVTSDDPPSAAIAWTTDLPATGEVRLRGPLQEDSGESARAREGVCDRLFSQEAPSQWHEIRITGLKPGRTYTYRVSSVAQDGQSAHSSEYAFRAAPARGKGKVRFLFTSDGREGVGGGGQTSMGTNLDVSGRIAREAMRQGADLAVVPGDLVNGYTSSIPDYRLQHGGWKGAWSGFWRTRPVYTSPGNHEALLNVFDDGSAYGLEMDKWPYASESAEAIFQQEFCNPANGPAPSDPRRPPYLETVYSFTYGPILFIALNNNYWWTSDADIPTLGGSPEGYIMEDQLAWAEGAIERGDRSPDVRFIVVFFHEPAFPVGPFSEKGLWWNGDNTVKAYALVGGQVVPQGQGVIDVRNRLWTAFARSRKVAAVLVGHQHAYSRVLIDKHTPVGIPSADDLNGDGKLERYSPNPDFTYPVYQITAGNGGAPPYVYPNRGTPWTAQVISPETGYCIFETDGNSLGFTAYSLNGQILDQVKDLMAVKKK